MNQGSKGPPDFNPFKKEMITERIKENKNKKRDPCFVPTQNNRLYDEG